MSDGRLAQRSGCTPNQTLREARGFVSPWLSPKSLHSAQIIHRGGWNSLETFVDSISHSALGINSRALLSHSALHLRGSLLDGRNLGV